MFSDKFLKGSRIVSMRFRVFQSEFQKSLWCFRRLHWLNVSFKAFEGVSEAFQMISNGFSTVFRGFTGFQVNFKAVQDGNRVVCFLVNFREIPEGVQRRFKARFMGFRGVLEDFKRFHMLSEENHDVLRGFRNVGAI